MSILSTRQCCRPSKKGSTNRGLGWGEVKVGGEWREVAPGMWDGNRQGLSTTRVVLKIVTRGKIKWEKKRNQPGCGQLGDEKNSTHGSGRTEREMHPREFKWPGGRRDRERKVRLKKRKTKICPLM